MYKVSNTVHKGFALSTELVNKERPTDAGPSNEPVSAKRARTTEQAVPMEYENQLALL